MIDRGKISFMIQSESVEKNHKKDTSSRCSFRDQMNDVNVIIIIILFPSSSPSLHLVILCHIKPFLFACSASSSFPACAHG